MTMMQPNQGAMRRLPVYLMLDCSGSMAGAPIVAVNEGLELLWRELNGDPMTRETAYLSLIRFASTAAQDPLVPVDQFTPQILAAGGNTAMGAAFNLLITSIQSDLVPTTSTQRGDYRPLVFLLTDGAPTDEWRSAVARLQGLRGSQKPTIIALGCGDNADGNMLREVTTEVYLMKHVTPDGLRQYFQLITGSIVSASQAAGGAGGGQVDMPAPTNIPGVIKYDL
jgi:uncharacterized protein YegL